MGPDGQSGHCLRYQHVELRLKGGRPSGQRRILVCVMTENPDFMLPLRVTLAGSIASDPLPVDSDGRRNREICVSGLSHLSGADYTVRAKQAVTIARMKAPRIGAGNMSLPKDVLGDAQLAPPRMASTSSQMTGRRRRLSARNASARRSLFVGFIFQS